MLVRRFSFPSPDKLLERVMPMLRANSEVRSILGEWVPASTVGLEVVLAVQGSCGDR